MRLIAFLLLTLGLAACDPANSNVTTVNTETKPPPTDQNACQAAGGDWRRVCLMGNFACVVSYSDAGKTCRDGKDCQGKQCRYEGKPVDTDKEVTGKCVATSDPCGCFTLVENGKATTGLCVD